MQRRCKSNVASSPCCLRSPKSRCGRTRRRRNPRSKASSLRPERINITIIIIIVIIIIIIIITASWDKFYYHRVSCSDHTSAILASSHSIFFLSNLGDGPLGDGDLYLEQVMADGAEKLTGNIRLTIETFQNLNFSYQIFYNDNISKFEFFLTNILQW